MDAGVAGGRYPAYGWAEVAGVGEILRGVALAEGSAAAAVVERSSGVGARLEGPMEQGGQGGLGAVEL